MRGFEWALREARGGDFDALLSLIEAYDVAVLGYPDYTADDLRTEWEKPDFDLATDAWVVVTPGGAPVRAAAGDAASEQSGQRLLGYAEAWQHVSHGRIEASMYHDPALSEAETLPVITALYEQVRQRAAGYVAAAGSPLPLRQFMVHEREPILQRVLEDDGFATVRHFWRMEIEMTAAPATPVWPAGVALRPFDPAQDARAVHAAIEEAFEDHWDHAPEPFEEWRRWTLERSNFDPALWLVAYAGNEIAGSSLCYQDAETGWVRNLAVRRPWRRQGLGLALLVQSFQEFWQRGERKVGLGVDTANLTGATRLYERAGMHVAKQFDLYEKIV